MIECMAGWMSCMRPRSHTQGALQSGLQRRKLCTMGEGEHATPSRPPGALTCRRRSSVDSRPSHLGIGSTKDAADAAGFLAKAWGRRGRGGERQV